METFYDRWLDARSSIEQDLRSSPLIARDSEIPWVSTPQDHMVKLMIGNELGFATMGSNILKAQIPVGWHTGQHRHGEESIHILEGEGFSVIDDQRFDWHAGSTIQIPFWAAHQHFNTGSVPVTYLSGMTFDLERYVRVARLEQLAECGPNDAVEIARHAPSNTQYYPDGARAIIHLEDAPTDRSYSTQGNIAGVRNQHDFVQFLSVPKNGFRGQSVAVTSRWIEPPLHQSGRHKHLEAVVYAVEGEGYSEMEGKRLPWRAGDVLYVPPAMWEHQHFNASEEPIVQLRIAFGIRTWYTDIWPAGFTTQRIYNADGTPIEAGPLERVRERG